MCWSISAIYPAGLRCIFKVRQGINNRSFEDQHAEEMDVERLIDKRKRDRDRKGDGEERQ